MEMHVGGACATMVIIGGNGHSNPSLNSLRLFAFHIELIPLGKIWIQLLSLQLWEKSRTD